MSALCAVLVFFCGAVCGVIIMALCSVSSEPDDIFHDTHDNTKNNH